MITFDYSNQGKRPSARQIIGDWKKAGRPNHFAATYGETYAEWQLANWTHTRWFASGNGCAGIKRDAVERALNVLAWREEPYQ